MKINNKGKGALIAAITAAATLLSCGLAAASASAAGVDYLPTIGQVPTIHQVPAHSRSGQER